MRSRNTTEARKERFARKWFSEWRPDPPVYGRASQLLDQLITHDPERAWDLVLALVHAAPDNDALDCVAAGPLEDLLCDHGAAFIERMETTLRADAHFMNCLARVWGWSRMEPTVHARMRRILGR
jgi:hypothetical protein